MEFGAFSELLFIAIWLGILYNKSIAYINFPVFSAFLAHMKKVSMPDQT